MARKRVTPVSNMKNVSEEVVRSLSPHYYTDPAVFDRERDSIFARTWQFAGHASQLEHPGNFFSFSIADQSLFCMRGVDGRVRTFYNVCQHRGHELVQGSGSCQMLVCPYHAWTYHLDGRLRSARNTKNVRGFEMSYPIDLDANEHAGEVSTWYLWPCFSFQVYPGNTLNTYHWQPVDVDHVVVWRGWFTIDGEESDMIRKLAVQDRETTVEEDLRLVESVQRGMYSRGYTPGPLVIDSSGSGVNSEHALHTLQGWFKEAVGE